METKTAVIIVNTPFGLEKDFSEQVFLFNKYIKEANLDCVILKDEEVIDYFSNNAQKVDFAIFWGKDIYLAKYLESIGVKIYNSSEAISICDDKALTFAMLKANNIDTPKTFILPYSYGYDLLKTHKNIISLIEEKFSYPLVLKKRVGSFGEGVYLINSHSDLISKLNEHKEDNLLVQEYIDSSVGVDYRVNVIGNNAVSIVKRVNSSNFKSNVHQGGHMELVDNPREDILSIAIKACNACKCDFAGVDIILDSNNKPLVLEVNSNARTVVVEKVSGIKVSEKIIKYCISKNG